jgi:hypothetical protein
MKYPYNTKTGIRISQQEGVYDTLLNDSGAIEMCLDGVAAASGMQTRLQEFRSECNISPLIDHNKNPFAGVDYYGIIFATDVSDAEKELELRRVILSTPGVLKILRFTWSQVEHSVAIEADVQTQWGAVSVAQMVSPL